MVRETLDRKIRHLLDEFLILDSMIEQVTMDAVDALKRHDMAAARKAYDFDAKVNAKRFEIENECMITIATQQPIMAGDLRLLASILEVVSELERMGDYAKGIAKICLMVGDQPHVKPLVDIPKMAEIAVSMLHRAASAFVDKDVAVAKAIPREDDIVDGLYNQVYHDLLNIMIADPTTIDRANYLMWAAHNLERLADRVTNICERAVYVATGELKEIDSSDGEHRS
jgi:phosphate transport system protein